jgi:hypothetical protein
MPQTLRGGQNTSNLTFITNTSISERGGNLSSSLLTSQKHMAPLLTVVRVI